MTTVYHTNTPAPAMSVPSTSTMTRVVVSTCGQPRMWDARFLLAEETVTQLMMWVWPQTLLHTDDDYQHHVAGLVDGYYRHMIVACVDAVPWKHLPEVWRASESAQLHVIHDCVAARVPQLHVRMARATEAYVLQVIRLRHMHEGMPVDAAVWLQ